MLSCHCFRVRLCVDLSGSSGEKVTILMLFCLSYASHSRHPNCSLIQYIEIYLAKIRRLPSYAVFGFISVEILILFL